MEVFLPQWQGAGDADAIYAGAQRLCRPGLAAIEPFTAEPSATEHGVRHYRAVVANLAAYRARLERDRPDRVFTLGGDCSVDIAPIRWLRTRIPDLAVVWFDAHADVNTPATSPSGTLHGMPVRVLLGDGAPGIADRAVLTPADVVYVGVRDLDAPEAAYLDAHRIRRISIDDWRHGAALPERPLYIHVDLDVLDPASFAGVACPTPGGFTRGELADAIAGIAHGSVIAGGSVLEFVGDAADEIAFARGLFRTLTSTQ